MKKLLIILLIAMPILGQTQGKIFTKKGKIKFESEAQKEDIQAVNRRVVSAIDTKSGAIEFSVLIRSFEFEKALMQEHFNEEYMESSKYPKATFKGKITNIDEINFQKDGTYKAKVKGKLTIHGVTKEVSSIAVFKVSDGKISAKSNFSVKVEDYNIEVPSMMSENIAEVIDVYVSISKYEEYKK